MSENRITINPRTGNEPGVNMWTGDPLPASASGKRVHELDPLSKLPQPFGITHYPTDGAVNPSIHPGTGNVDRRTNLAAWHERSAIHRALDEGSPTPFADRDAVTHTAFIHKLLSTKAGRALLGPAADKYEAAARILPHLTLGTADAGSLYSSNASARPVGPRMDALTELARPLVSVANRLLVKAGRARPMESLDYTNPPDRKPAAEAADPTDAAAKAVADKRAKDADSFSIKAGGKVKPEPKPDYVDQSAPIPLVDDPKVRGNRWAMIVQMVKAGNDRQHILAALKAEHGLTDRQAADTYRRFARSEDARRAVWSANSPVKLARKPKAEPAPDRKHQPSPAELKGTAFKEPDDTYAPLPQRAWPTKDVPVHPELRDTSMAYHLRQIAHDYDLRAQRGDDRAGRIRTLAEHVLAGKSMPGVNGDVYASLGKELKQDKHRYAGLYNWDTMDRSLMQDHLVKNAIGKLIARPEGMNESTFWDRVRRQFGGEQSGNPRYEEFWRRVKDHIGHHSGFGTPEGFINNVKNSLLRISDRALDRDYMGAVRAEQKSGKKHGELWDSGNGLHWRDVLGRTPVGAHKLQRQAPGGHES